MTEADVSQVVQWLLHQFQKPFIIDQAKIPANLSIGVSMYPDHGTELTELIKKADFAMYEAIEQPSSSAPSEPETNDENGQAVQLLNRKRGHILLTVE